MRRTGWSPLEAGRAGPGGPAGRHGASGRGRALYAAAAGSALALLAAGLLIMRAGMLPPRGPAAETAVANSTDPAPQGSGPAAYEATVLVMTDAPQRYEARARSRAFEVALRGRVLRERTPPGSGLAFQVFVRPVPRAPLVLVSARAPVPELASRLAHEAAYLLMEQAQGRSNGGFIRARLLPGTCSPPSAVLPEAPSRPGRPES